MTPTEILLIVSPVIYVATWIIAEIRQARKNTPLDASTRAIISCGFCQFLFVEGLIYMWYIQCR